MRIPSFSRFTLSVTACVALTGLPLVLSGCDSDEGSSHTKTTTKRVVDTPEAKTTTTTTHEKKTDTYPRD